ncbi:hypothetical protein COEREDRAFT_97164 [Coemansia reversa NRRL 1564]|uniref:Uncharacterized protein n=1 Tax=Coemansia reversa (strain ATCC 12441 / NRRL 1564) TaxID=763665 RepID=A0A2G5BCZ6_COERN|nr:hypothetical protein COEREDRAFT_97164 [Coemansia reversa NRRL 1564]|eukprot:PIA16886.1 hypothetical protein COEREDRAFT_97164 [Coemansia reversa NRRL 1564]
MGYKYPKYAASSSGSAQHHTKRRRTNKGKKPAYIGSSTEVDAETTSEMSILSALPRGFPSPPSGYEFLFKAWGSMWYESYGTPNASSDLRKKLLEFKEAVEAAQNNRISVHGNAVGLQSRALEIQSGVLDDILEAIANLQRKSDKIDATVAINNKDDYAAHIKYIGDLIDKLTATDVQENNTLERHIEAVDNTHNATKMDETHRAVQEHLENAYVVSVRFRYTKLTCPLELIHTDKHIELPLYPVVSAAPNPQWCFDYRFVRMVEVFQDEMLFKHHVLSICRFPSASRNTANYHHPRYFADKHGVGSFFKAEVVKRAIMIIAMAHNDARILAIDGHLPDDADMFLRVCISPEVDKIIESKVVVEFGLSPEHINKFRAPFPLPSASPLERLQYKAAFPLLGFESVLQQAHFYARDKSSAPSVFSSVNTKYAIVTTFNELWVLQMHDDGAGDSDRIVVSSCFWVNNATPHISFVVAYVLHLVIEDMMANPDDYASPVSDLLATEGEDSVPPVLKSAQRS